MKVDLRTFELQNLVATATGLRTRKNLVELKTPTAGTEYVGGFSIKSPRTTEVHHFLFEQVTASGALTLRCYTEEYFELWNLPLGVVRKDPVITHGVAQMQIMAGSPSFSTPLYGLVGGSLIPATKKTSSINDDTTALDLMPGHIAQFGDRFGIANGDLFGFNDPGVDPRTFVVENQATMPGFIYDWFQGPDRGLYFFTSAGAFTLPQDALGQGQEVQGFIGTIPGVQTTRPRNACASAGAVAVLQRDHLLLLPGTRIPLTQPGRRRSFSAVLEVEDLRRAGELFATPDGFYVGFRGARGHFAMVNAATHAVSWVTNSTAALNLVGVLTSRDGEALPVLSNRVCAFFGRGPTDAFNSASVVAVATGSIPVAPDDRPVVRRVTVAADNVAETVGASVDGTARTTTTPTKTGDVLISAPAADLVETETTPLTPVTLIQAVNTLTLLPSTTYAVTMAFQLEYLIGGVTFLGATGTVTASVTTSGTAITIVSQSTSYTLAAGITVTLSSSGLDLQTMADWSTANPIDPSDVVTRTVCTCTASEVAAGAVLWDATGGIVGRATRSSRISLKVRSSNPSLEVEVVGADRAVSADVEVELGGQGRGRRDNS